VISNVVRPLARKAQLLAEFEPGDPHSGFYNDLRDVALSHGTPARALDRLCSMTEERRLANPVSIAQIGLGGFQLSRSDPAWVPVVEKASRWLVAELDPEGRLAYLFPMPHTFSIDPPWYSAMAQGEAASLLVRAAQILEQGDLDHAAARAVRSLLDERFGLVTEMPEGPVLQEYPTSPPAHALNGWITALWGVYDVSLAFSVRTGDLHAVGVAAAEAFDRGARSLAARLPLYDAWLGWSRYDLFPHRIVHVASPFYHRLHIEQLRAMARLRPDLRPFQEFADHWERGARNPLSRTCGVAGKIAFRLLEPRKPPA
jgi:heparosan-N-sulfate-glucuronate 5-epimerase